MDGTTTYVLTRLDGIKDLLVEQRRLLEDIQRSQQGLAGTAGASGDTLLMRLLKSWPQIVAIGVKHVLTVLTIGAMIKQGADATTLIEAISKLL